MPNLLRYAPAFLTMSRGALAPVMVWLALHHPSKPLFGALLTYAFLSDIFDGIIARRLKIATPTLRRLDSIADSVFYIAAIFAVLYLYPDSIFNRLLSFSLLISLELTRYLFDLIKFRREAAYHMWSSKLWGIVLFAAFFSLLATGTDNFLITAAIYLGIIADIEGLGISLILKTWTNDIPTIFHAQKLQRAANI